MARSINASTQAQADSGELLKQDMILFAFGSPVTYYGFWTGAGVFTHNTIDYQPGASLFEIEPFRETEGLESIGYIGRLRAVPNTDLSPDVLATIEAEDYHQTPVVISTAYFDPDDPLNVLSVETEYRGYLDQIVHREQGDEYWLEARLESKSRDNRKRGYRVRSDPDQRLLDANDGFLRHAATVPLQRIVWGRESE